MDIPAAGERHQLRGGHRRLVFLGAHGSYFDLGKKRELLAAGGDGTVFVDPEGHEAFVDCKQKQFREELARQQAAAAE